MRGCSYIRVATLSLRLINGQPPEQMGQAHIQGQTLCGYP